MGLQKMSARSLAGFGPGLLSLSLEENQLEELPDLSPLTGLQYLTLNKNPLMCDCKLLPFYRWLKNASLRVEAVCSYPSELRGQSVMETAKNCSGENATSFNETSIPTKATTLKKPMQTTTKARPMQTETNPKPAKTKLTVALKKNESDELKPVQALKKNRPSKKKRGRQPRIKSSMKKP